MTQDTEDVVARFRSNILLSSSIRGGSLNHLEDHEVRAVIRAALEASERQSLSDRIDVLTRELAETSASLERMTEVGRRALDAMQTAGIEHEGDVHANDPALTDLRAALHQEGIATDVGRNPATHEPSPVSRSRPCGECPA